MAGITTAEMIITAVGTLGTGVIGKGIHWFANKVIDNSETSQEILSEIRSIKQSLYGNPDSHTPDGLQATLVDTRKAVATVDGKVDEIGGQVEKLDIRLSVVERGCLAQHGQRFFREPQTNE